MQNRYIIEPDDQFVKGVIELGGESLKKCFQCGTCSVVCSLSPSEKPFPRKEMIWTQWGLKNRVLEDPDVWLCHQCTDCSTNCPRGAKPGDVLAAIRNYSIVHFTLPNFLAKYLSKLTYLLFILPIVILAWLIPLRYIPSVFFVIGSLAVIITIIGMLRFWRNISNPESGVGPVTQRKKGFWGSLGSALAEILIHKNFKQCDANGGIRYPHLFTLYGFILLAISHFVDQLYPIAGIGQSPVPLTDPFKIVGNIGALILLVGLILIIYRRLIKKDDVGTASYFDWFFLALAFLITFTGLATEIFRLTGVISLLHWSYLIHLLLLLTLLIYAPFSKLTHLLYRTLAMTYAKQVGRELENDVA